MRWEDGIKSPTLHDVAQLAGVSYATADRVQNRRGNVAEKSVRKVERAMEQLGYVRNVAAANLSRSRVRRLAFVLPSRSHPFFLRMHEQIAKFRQHIKAAQLQLDVIEFPAFDTEALEIALWDLLAQRYDGIACVGQGQDRALTMLREAGAKVVTLVSDGPKACRDHYIGIDNVKAGRTAARMVGMAHRGQPGRVIPLAGSLDVRDHGDRIRGFTEVLRSDYPQIEFCDLIETKDQDRLMRQALRARVETEQAVTAIYNAGAGNDGLIEVLGTTDQEKRIFCIIHEVSGKSREALKEGVVDVAIDQRPEIEMSRALALLQAIVDDLPPPPAPELIPAIYVRDNLPDDPL
ncbi:LacI family DNA-binding transcriptional regulator [Gymnodinialimonas ulvae]|uniref:LacI family DNA-binding transcriptional regulator n=1 Tax=Gymnodinialimonas ulvae TaxID=3126504 RepID=UPI0030B1E7FD